MSYTYIYRLEHKDLREGPFRSKDHLEFTDQMIDRFGRFNTPWEDKLTFRAGLHLHGVPTRKWLLAWFGPYLKFFEERGYVVALYKVKDHQKGKHQVLFEKGKGQLLATYAPTQWANRKETAA